MPQGRPLPALSGGRSKKGEAEENKEDSKGGVTEQDPREAVRNNMAMRSEPAPQVLLGSQPPSQ